MRLYRTSVKDDLNVGAVFRDLAESYVDKVNSYRYKGQCKLRNLQGLVEKFITPVCSDLAYNDGDLVNPNGLRPPSMVQIGSRPQQPPPAYVISATANGNGYGNNRREDYDSVTFRSSSNSP